MSDDEDSILPTTLLIPPPTCATSTQSPCIQAVNQSPGCEGQVNKNTRKRKRKLATDEESIASAISSFFKEILEVEKIKMSIAEKMIESERESRDLAMKGQLQMATLFVEVFKCNDSSSTSK